MLGLVYLIFLAFLVRVIPVRIVAIANLLAGIGWLGFAGLLSFAGVYPFTATFSLFFRWIKGIVVVKAFIFLNFCSVFQPADSPLLPSLLPFIPISR